MQYLLTQEEFDTLKNGNDKNYTLLSDILFNIVRCHNKDVILKHLNSLVKDLGYAEQDGTVENTLIEWEMNTSGGL